MNKRIVISGDDTVCWDAYLAGGFPDYMGYEGSVYILKNSLHYFSAEESEKYRVASNDALALVWLPFSLRDLLGVGNEE